MSRRKVGVLDVSSAVHELLAQYGDQVNEVVDESMKTVAEEAESELKQVSRFSSKGHPSGDYSKDWDMTFEASRTSWKYTVYNVAHYQLTHLLESGHAKFLWGREAGGQVQGFEHIKPVNDKAQERIVQEITERITNI